MTFDRSSFMVQRHKQAKQQIELYKREFGEDSKVKYSHFLKDETPLSEGIVIYDVSYQMTYSGNVDTMTFNPKTFRVLGLSGQEQDIYDRTMGMFIDSKGNNSGNHLAPNTIETIENNMDIKVYPRGMEKSERKPTREEIIEVLNNQYVVKELDDVTTFTNKKGKKGELKLDLRHFG